LDYDTQEQWKQCSTQFRQPKYPNSQNIRPFLWKSWAAIEKIYLIWCSQMIHLCSVSEL